MENPLHKIWAKLHEGSTKTYGMTEFPGKDMPERMGRQMEASRGRDECVDLYAWAVPTEEIIDAVAQFSPIVEIGAGRGYWAALLQEAGADVVAHDILPPSGRDQNTYHRSRHKSMKRVFTEVLKGDHRTLEEVDPSRSLFLCWPPYNTPMAFKCLTAFTGNRLIYVGEGYGGCTGDDQFHAELEENWEETLDFEIPTWWGIRDYLTVWERKK